MTSRGVLGQVTNNTASKVCGSHTATINLKLQQDSSDEDFESSDCDDLKVRVMPARLAEFAI